jgi:hypothetical protein
MENLQDACDTGSLHCGVILSDFDRSTLITGAAKARHYRRLLRAFFRPFLRPFFADLRAFFRAFFRAMVGAPA